MVKKSAQFKNSVKNLLFSFQKTVSPHDLSILDLCDNTKQREKYLDKVNTRAQEPESVLKSRVRASPTIQSRYGCMLLNEV